MSETLHVKADYIQLSQDRWGHLAIVVGDVVEIDDPPPSHPGTYIKWRKAKIHDIDTFWYGEDKHE